MASDPSAGWAVVNKPPGMHCKRCGGQFTLEDYLPALVPPPTAGTHGPGPRVCHRLDFRVAGPVLVASSQEAMRRAAERPTRCAAVSLRSVPKPFGSFRERQALLVDVPAICRVDSPPLQTSLAAKEDVMESSPPNPKAETSPRCPLRRDPQAEQEQATRGLSLPMWKLLCNQQNCALSALA